MQPIGGNFRGNLSFALARQRARSRRSPAGFGTLASRSSFCWLLVLCVIRVPTAAQGAVNAATAQAPPVALGLEPVAPGGGSPQGALKPDAEALRAELAGLIEQLDADAYDVRRRAAMRLDELCTRPELGPALAVELRRLLLGVDLSFEVRRRLEQCARRLPEATPALEAPPPGPGDLDGVVEGLQSPSFAVRRAAESRLEWLLSEPRLAGPLLGRLKNALAQAGQQPDTWRALAAAWHRARRVWLLAGGPEDGLAVPSSAQINAWVSTLAGSLPDDQSSAAWLHVKLAEMELLDALAQDRCVPVVRAALEVHLHHSSDPAAAARLAKFLELTQSALVAEFWQDRQHLGEQHLLVGVPSMAEGAVRPSHFDRIDERTAHCVSGQTLSPGDYPVGVAFPNPQIERAFFHLVNLPTPRRRMAYAFQVQADQTQRLRAISRRTLDRFLAERRLLDEPELVMLAQLDPEEVSRFASRYLLLVEDQPLPALDGPQRIGGRPSRHGLLCGLLAVEGTRSASEGLLKAIERHAFLPPTSAAPYRLEYVAAMAIARRDPWPTADQWLASQIGQREPLIDGHAAGAELGATAAAILLERHGHAASAFGLQAIADPLLLEVGVPGYRFATEQDRQRVEQWWDRVAASRQRP